MANNNHLAQLFPLAYAGLGRAKEKYDHVLETSQALISSNVASQLKASEDMLQPLEDFLQQSFFYRYIVSFVPFTKAAKARIQASHALAAAKSTFVENLPSITSGWDTKLALYAQRLSLMPWSVGQQGVKRYGHIFLRFVSYAICATAISIFTLSLLALLGIMGVVPFLFPIAISLMAASAVVALLSLQEIIKPGSIMQSLAYWLHEIKTPANTEKTISIKDFLVGCLFKFPLVQPFIYSFFKWRKVFINTEERAQNNAIELNASLYKFTDNHWSAQRIPVQNKTQLPLLRFMLNPAQWLQSTLDWVTFMVFGAADLLSRGGTVPRLLAKGIKAILFPFIALANLCLDPFVTILGLPGKWITKPLDIWLNQKIKKREGQDAQLVNVPHKPQPIQLTDNKIKEKITNLSGKTIEEQYKTIHKYRHTPKFLETLIDEGVIQSPWQDQQALMYVLSSYQLTAFAIQMTLENSKKENNPYFLNEQTLNDFNSTYNTYLSLNDNLSAKEQLKFNTNKKMIQAAFSSSLDIKKIGQTHNFFRFFYLRQLIKTKKGILDNIDYSTGTFTFKEKKYVMVNNKTVFNRQDCFASVSKSEVSREIILLDPNSKYLDETYQAFKKQNKDLLKNKIRVISKLAQLEIWAKKFLNLNEKENMDVVVKKWLEDGGDTIAYGNNKQVAVIPLEYFIKNKTAVCRVYSLCLFYMLNRLIEDKILPRGKAHHFQSIVSYDNNRPGSHAFAVFHDTKNKESYVIDPMFKITSSITKNKDTSLKYVTTEYKVNLSKYYGPIVKNKLEIAENAVQKQILKK